MQIVVVKIDIHFPSDCYFVAEFHAFESWNEPDGEWCWRIAVIE